MTRRLTTAMLAVFTLAIASGFTMLAHEGHEHTVMGTITMAAADHVMLKDTDGKDVTIHVTSDTKVTKDQQTMKAQDIKVGTRVVTAVEEQEQTKAQEIQVGAEEKTAAK